MLGRRRTQKSIFDASAPTPKGSRRRGPALAAAGTAAALLAAGAAWTIAGPNIGPGDAAASPLSGPAVEEQAGPHVDVLIDGWTMKTIGGPDKLQVSFDDAEQANPVQVRPANADDLAEIQRSTPQLLTLALARLATTDSDLSCTPDGCKDSTGEVPTSWLLKPADIDGYGRSYNGYGIEHGLYVARIPSKDAVGRINVGAPGFDALPLSPTPDVDDPASKPTPDNLNGFLRSRYLVSAGLGQFFQPMPSWLGGGKDPVRFQARGAADSADAATLDPASPVTFLQGLGTSYEQAKGLTYTQLTFMTSPTTGCGVGVVCVPGTLEPTVVKQDRTATKVCRATEGAGVAVLDDVRLKVNYPAPTHQAGAWNGTTPTGDRVGILPGVPELLSGEQELRWSAIGFFDGDPLTLRTLSGSTRQGPGADLAGPTTLTQMLSAVRYDGEHVSSCE